MKNVVNEHAEALEKALSEIPLEGEIKLENFNQYIDKFNIACVQQKRKPKIASYTRFLALIRPDFFVAINDKNKKGIAKAFGFKTISKDNYWELLEKLHQLTWYKERISKDNPDYHLWIKRAAMLDAIYYEHES